MHSWDERLRENKNDSDIECNWRSVWIFFYSCLFVSRHDIYWGDLAYAAIELHYKYWFCSNFFGVFFVCFYMGWILIRICHAFTNPYFPRKFIKIYLKYYDEFLYFLKILWNWFVWKVFEILFNDIAVKMPKHAWYAFFCTLFIPQVCIVPFDVSIWFSGLYPRNSFVALYLQIYWFLVIFYVTDNLSLAVQ